MELTHYQMIVEFMNDMGDCADVPKIDSISDKINTLGDSLEIGYETELEVYNQYKKFYEMAEEEDCVVAQFLLQFMEIQRKAVGEYGDLLAKYKIAEENKEILFFDKGTPTKKVWYYQLNLDRNLGKTNPLSVMI